MESENLARTLILESRIKGERIIAFARLILCGFLIIMIAFVIIFGSIARGKDILREFLNPAIISEMSCIIISVLISLWVFRKTKEKQYYSWMPYVFPFIDITSLSIIIFFNAIPVNALVFTGAPTFLYIVFLVLAAFRNSVSSVIFTGVYISISYFIISFFHALVPLHIFESGGHYFANNFGNFIEVTLDDEILKSVIFLMITGLLAYIAHCVKKIFTGQTEIRVENDRIRTSFSVNLITVTDKVLDSSTLLTSCMERFTENVETMLTQSRKSKQEIDEAFRVMEETVTTITKIIHSNQSITDSVLKQSQLLEDGVSSLEQMRKSINNITSTSKKADGIAGNLFSAAKDGEMTTRETVRAIQETEKSGIKIEEIVEIITGITSSTNLLAMNAAIEAAHAGDTGRGFAVVADEIRSLAETSSGNTKQISTIVKDILKKIENITASSGDAQKKLESILIDAEKTKGINSEILLAMEEESSAMQIIFSSFQILLTITEEVRDACYEQTSGGREIFTAIEKLKLRADEVTNLIKKQVDECNKIEENTSELLFVLSNNKEIVEKLGYLVKQV